MIEFAVSYIIPILLGYFTLVDVWTIEKIRIHSLVRIFLAIAIGFGISSSIFFICLPFIGLTKYLPNIIEIMILIILVIIYLIQICKKSLIHSEKTTFLKKKTHKILCCIFVGELIFAVICFFALLIKNPFGTWDALLIWNLHAKFLFKSGILWRDYFNSGLSWTHPDYPLLLPGLITHSWVSYKHINTLTPIIISIFYSFGLVGLLYSSLSYLKNNRYGYIAGIILVSTPFFIVSATTQCADIPLSFYFLTTLIFFCLYNKFSKEKTSFLIFAGLSAGFAAWCKNEGMMFVLNLLLIHMFITVKNRNWKLYLKELKYISFGLVPVLIMILYFKFNIAPQNDLLAGFDYNILIQNLTDKWRYITIFRNFLSTSLNFTYGFINPLILLICTVCIGIKNKSRYKLTLKLFILQIIFMVISYFLVFLVTPHNIEWHLSNSLNRLFLQLWPMFIFICFMLI